MLTPVTPPEVLQPRPSIISAVRERWVWIADDDREQYVQEVPSSELWIYEIAYCDFASVIDAAPVEVISTATKWLEFESYKAQWLKERNPLSSNAWNNIRLPAYQRIIGMGPQALPLILKQLNRETEVGEPDDWFVALWAITGENPVPPESRGNVKEMAKAWLEWGFREGYLDGEDLGAFVSKSRAVGKP